MAKTVSVAQLNHGGASKAIRDAQEEPILVTKENRPAAWIISADRVAGANAANDGSNPDDYQRVLNALALHLYENESLTLGQAATLAGLSLQDFIDLCGRARVAVLWDSPEGIIAEVNSISRIVPPCKDDK